MQTFNASASVPGFDWRLPLYGWAGSAALMIPALFGEADLSILLYGLTIVVVTLVLLSLTIKEAVVRNPQRCLSILATLLVCWATSVAFLWNYGHLRTKARWFALSRQYEARVLAQPLSPTGELKHIEWDGWGMFGNDTSVFLVFDPNDSLLEAAQSGNSGKLDGISCQVYRVRRMQSHWYTVQFYTNESWGQCT